jgi:hypothetical protein
MKTWTTETWIATEPAEVLAVMVEPAAIARWSPVPYELLELDGDRLESGSRARVRGSLGGRSLEFTVHVHQANDGRLALLADGPVAIDAEYLLEEIEGGSRLRASVRVGGRGLVGTALAGIADGLLAAGLLRISLARLAGQAQTRVQR